MPIYQGAAYQLNFTWEDDDGLPIDVSDWEFAAHIKDARADTTALVSLTTANGGFSVTDGPGGRFQMVLTAEQTESLPVGGMVFDVLRTDADPGPTFLMSGSFRVKLPVTVL